MERTRDTKVGSLTQSTTFWPKTRHFWLKAWPAETKKGNVTHSMTIRPKARRLGAK